jgi:hypothetical protein
VHEQQVLLRVDADDDRVRRKRPEDVGQREATAAIVAVAALERDRAEVAARSPVGEELRDRLDAHQPGIERHPGERAPGPLEPRGGEPPLRKTLFARRREPDAPQQPTPIST